MKQENKFMKKFLSILKIIVFFLILSVSFNFVNNIVKGKYSYERMNDFFSQKEDFDVLFFGSSHVFNAIYPMELWKNHGIVSYNVSKSGETLPVSYHNIKLASKYHKPKLVVLDAFMVYSEDKVDNLHKSLDAYPLSIDKYLAVKDIYGKNNLLENEIEYLFDFSLYHSRWNKLIKDDFINKDTIEKGAVIEMKIATPLEKIDYDDVLPYNGKETINMKYLRKIIKYCKENNIEILITYLPHTMTEKSISDSKYVKIICDEYNVDYIDFLGMNIVNYNTDFHNMYVNNSHLNPSGARKVSDYLGKYIIKNYNIKDNRNNKTYDFLNNDYDKYIDLKIQNLKNNNKDIYIYLMALYGENDIKYKIKISSKLQINDDNLLKELLENLDNNYEIDDSSFEQKEDKNIKITTYDNRNGKLIEEVWFNK